MQVNRDILNEAWLRVNQRILSYILHLGSPFEDAEEIRNQTYIQAVNSLDTLRNIKSIDGWLFSIAGTQFSNHYRAKNTQKRKANLISLDPSMDRPDHKLKATDESLIEAQEATSMKEKLRICIKKLPDQMRRVIQLQYHNEKPLNKISAILGIKLNTVKSTANAARTKLKACIQELSKGEHHG